MHVHNLSCLILQVSAYPGELIKLRIIPYDEQNFIATNMFEIKGYLNQSLDSVSLYSDIQLHTLIELNTFDI